MVENMQLPELRQLAKERGFKNISKLKKNELIELLEGNEKEEAKEEINEIENIQDDIIEEKEEFISRKWSL